MEKRGDVLYVGIDESNHGRYPEIVAAVASPIASDARTLKMSHAKRIMKKELKRLLEHPYREFCWTSIEERQIKKTENPLVVAAPCLLAPLIDGKDFSRLEIFLDGELRQDEGLKLGLELIDILKLEEVKVNNLVKRHGGFNYTQLLIMADGLAYYAFRQKPRKLIEGLGIEGKKVPFTRYCVVERRV